MSEDDVDQPLHPNLLRMAYAAGYFPMPDPATDQILWFDPDPRAVIPLDGFHLSRSLGRRIAQKKYQVRFDTAFADVMAGCADRPDTWINETITAAYTRLFDEGDAHSVEIWQDGELSGGLYGVSIGGAFFAESMFHRRTDASKIAVYELVEKLKRQGFALLEVQFMTPHLRSLGAVQIPARDYKRRLAQAVGLPVRFGAIKNDVES